MKQLSIAIVFLAVTVLALACVCYEQHQLIMQLEKELCIEYD